MATLFGTPILRSLFLVGAFMFFAFGLWNVLLLPFAITVARRHRVRVRPAGRPDLGRVRDRHPVHGPLQRAGCRSGWIVVVPRGHGHRSASCTACRRRCRSPSCSSTISGFFQPPSSVSRSVLLQRNTPREMRGRVFSAFYVMRDVIFLLGMAGAGLADIVDIRMLIIVASCCCSCPRPSRSSRPASASRTWGAAAARLRGARPGAGHRPGRARDAGRLRPARGRLGVFGAAVARPAESAFVPRRPSARCRPGRASSSTATPHRPRTSSSMARRRRGVPADDGYRGLSTMAAGDFFGEIAALTGSARTADVVADVDRRCSRSRPTRSARRWSCPRSSGPSCRRCPSRLERTDAAGPAAPGGRRPGGTARPADAATREASEAGDPA